MMCLRIAAPAVLLLALSGCSDGRPECYPVRGTVKFADGEPVKIGTVEFESLEHGLTAQGTINDDGSYRLTTFKPHDGAVEGEHVIIVVQILGGEQLVQHQHDHGRLVDPRFADYHLSGLTTKVQPQEDNVVDLVVEEKKTPPGRR